MIQELDPPVILNTNLVRNPRQVATGTQDEMLIRWGWVRSFGTDGDGTPYSRYTVGGGSVGGSRGVDWYGNMDVAPATTGRALLVPVTQGVPITVWLNSRASVAGSGLTLRWRVHDGAGGYAGSAASAVLGTTTTDWTAHRVDITPNATGYLFLRHEVNSTGWTSTDYLDQTRLYIGAPGDYFDGTTTPSAGVVYTWAGASDGSVSYQMTPAAYLPVQDVSTLQVLYGSRVTSYRYELLTHNADGTDSLSGYLDGVLPTGSLDWQWTSQVKGGGTLNVLDLDTAQPGRTRIRDVNLTTMRVRPVLVVEGLPDIPLGVYLVTAGPEVWSSEGRQYNLELHDRTTVLDQDQIAETFTADATTPVMTQIANLIATAGEKFTPDNSETRTLAAAAVWPVGTSKLTIVNDLLQALNYFALTISGSGDFLATPNVLPADRTITYQLLNGVTRELIDGESSIYQPDWNRDRDVYGVPNKVVAVATGSGTDAPAQGSYSNTDPASPFSYAAKGRWIVSTVSGVQVPSDTDPVTFLNSVARDTLIAMSSPQATVTVKHLPLPLNVGDVIRFASTPAGIDARHVVVGLHLDLNALGLMQSNLQEVIDL